MKIKIYSLPQFLIPFTLVQVRVLMKFSAAHYDATCKKASAVGGFLYGWKNHLTFDEKSEVTATWRELDICLKLIEMPYYMDKESDDAIATVRAVILRCLSTSSRLTPSWTTEFELEIKDGLVVQ